jgi:uncharacterized PurR-regulated membrane protein YhhQ (DUF165 family)
VIRAAVVVVAYAGSIVAANVATDRIGLVSVAGLVVTAGTFLAGLTLILRDAVDAVAGRRVMLAAIATGVALSAATTTPSLAVASAVAFGVSELADAATWTQLCPRSMPWAVLVSSAVSAPIDSVLFLAVAGFPVTAPAIAGQVSVKVGFAALFAIVLAVREARR